MTRAFALTMFLAALLALAPGSDAGSAAAAEAAVRQTGTAAYYADRHHGRKMASGERYDQNKLTAASRSLPLGSRAVVTNVETGQSVQVEITDRVRRGRTIDLSRAAARRIGLDRQDGTAQVRVEATASDQPTPELRAAVEKMAAAQRPRSSQGQTSRTKPVSGKARQQAR